MRRKIIVSLVLIVFVLAAGVGGMFMLIRSRPAPETVDTTRPPLVVEAVVVKPQTIQEKIVGYGTARADRYARISAEVAGEVVERADRLKPGEAFTEADILLRIDDREYLRVQQQAAAALQAERQRLAQLDVEEANIERMLEITGRQYDIQKAEFDRVAALFEQNAANSSEFRQQRLSLTAVESRLQEYRNAQALLPAQRAALAASCERLEAHVEVAALNVARCTIRAPFDGRVDEVMVERGEHVQQGMALLTLLDPDLLVVPVELPVSVRGWVRAGAACSLALESADAAAWEGVVARISPTAREATRTFNVFVEVANERQPLPLMPGLFLQATIDGRLLENVLVVPRNAIRNRKVFIYRDGQSIPRPIMIEQQLLDQSVVRGLAPGDVVITSNLDALYEGASVLLASAEEEAPPLPDHAAGSDLLAEKK